MGRCVAYRWPSKLAFYSDVLGMGNKENNAPFVRPESDKPQSSLGTVLTYWDDIICVRCMRRGRAHWEESPKGRQLIGIDGDFYERLAKKSYHIELVCNGCGTVQPRRTER